LFQSSVRERKASLTMYSSKQIQQNVPVPKEIIHGGIP
jgi:hypothetical protein